MRRLLSAIAAVVLTSAAAPAHASATARAVDLGVLPGGDRSHATGVNDAGVVVGHSSTGVGDSPLRAVSWTPDGRITDLGTLPGDVASTASGITDSGVVYGHSSAEGGPQRAVRWVDGVIEHLPPLPGHVETRARAINESGTVVGVSVGTDRDDQHAVAWDRSGRVVRLAELPGDRLSQASDVNSAGLVVGYSGRGGPDPGLHPVVWTPDGGVTPLAFDGSTEGFAAGIDDAGVVAATAVDRDGRSHAVRFDPAGRGTDLGADLRATGIGEDGTVLGARSDRGRLHGARWRPGTTEAEFLSVNYAIATANRAGTAVGTTKGAGPTGRAMLWGADEDTHTRLPSLGGPSSGARDVNDRGVVVGAAEVAGGTWHAVKWVL